MSDEYVTRQILGNVPGWLVALLYISTTTAMLLAAACIALRMKLHARGRSEGRTANAVLRRIANLAGYLTFQRHLMRDPYAGIAHLLTFHGFAILFAGTCLVFVEHDTPLHFFYGRFYEIASLVVDLGGIAFIVGLSMFLARRVTARNNRLLHAWWVPALSIVLLLVAVSGFLLEGARIAVDMPEHERWSWAGYQVARVFHASGISGDQALAWHRGLWAGHSAVSVAFLALLPWRFFSHILYGPASFAIRSFAPRGKLPVCDVSQHAPGAVVWSDLLRRDLLHADACTTCGRCNSACPATAAGKPLQPRDVVLGIRAAMNAHTPGSTASPDHAGHLAAYVADDAIWSCTTCGACNAVCPVGIDVYQKIVDLRRGRVESATIPKAAVQVFEDTASCSNPFGKPHADRLNWANHLNVPVAQPAEEVELLYWVGCAGSFDPDGQRIVRAMTTILERLGVSYRILGRKEHCTGDPARRLGEEGLFREMAHANIAALAEHKVRNILTNCPHCLNTLRNEYSELGGRYRVEHHSQFLARMIRQGRLRRPDSPATSVTFHDPCYLSRGNDETQAPRDVINSMTSAGVREMPRHGRNSFCCGAGGGSMWLDGRGERRIENMRAVEAASTGAAVVATACPFCKSMLLAGRQALGTSEQGLQVLDLAELVVQTQGW